MNTRTKTAVIALVLIAAAGFGAYRWYFQKDEPAKPATPATQTEPVALDAGTAPAAPATAG